MKGVFYLVFLGLLALAVTACTETQAPEITPNLTVTVSPSNAVVSASVAGQALDATTEGELTLQGRSVYRYQADGEYVVVRADAEGYEPFERRVFVRKGQTAKIDVSLPERGKGKPVAVTIHIDAGENQTVELDDTAILQGIFETDSEDITPEIKWSVVAGARGVTFDAADEIITGATFPKIGRYRLRITGRVGEVTVFDDMKVDVVANSKPQEPTPEPTPNPTPNPSPDPTEPDPEDTDGHPHGFQKPLIDSYAATREITIAGETYREVELRGLRYRPRQSSYKGYEGWDVFELPRTKYISYNKADWLTLNFNRDARVVVLWNTKASWLADWDQGSIGSLNTFTKNVSKGELVLPPPGSGQSRYTLLLAEKGGTPSSEPPLPGGVSEAERPRPNQACPTWLHDSYLAEGPEGSLYQSWHPQIDPVYWCYFGHEHGSDPALVSYAPAFKYVADKNFRQNEQHEGFKGFAVRDEAKGLGWYFNIHATTSARERMCTRFHTVVIAVTDLKTGELLAELGYKGDFGALRTTEQINGENVLVQPTFMADCPDQADIAKETDAVKLIRVQNEPIIERGGYEKWTGGVQPALGIGFNRDGLQLDIRDPITDCDGLACDAAIVNRFAATTRSLALPKLSVSYTPEVEAFDLADGKRDGVFYTDPYGEKANATGGETLVRQYIKPGLEVRVEGFLVSEDPWHVLYQFNEGRVIALELENSIGSEN